MKKFFLLICVFVCILSMTAVAESDVQFSLTSAQAKPGDEIELTLSVKGNEPYNSIALSNFVYDKDSLEFVAFENYDSIKSLAALTPFFDEEKMAIVIGFKKKAAHSVDICTIRFRVKDGATGTVTISATPIAKNSSTVLTSSFTPAVVTVKSEPVTVKGTSLVLDGSIGVKTYFEIDTESVDISSAKLSAEIYNSKLDKTDILDSGILYDEDKGLYCSTVYVAPKDAPVTEIRASLEYVTGGKTLTLGIPVITIPSYIEDFKELAKNDPEYADGLRLVEALDTYTRYAENFFSDKVALEDVEVDISAINSVADPEVSGSAVSIELYATSLILEDKTTIRHYFNVSKGADISSFTFKIGDKTLTPMTNPGAEYIYVDIPDILAHDMDKTFDLVVCDGMTVSYSVMNYVKLALNSDDAKMRNLVKVLYNYHVEAKAYK